MSVCPTECRIFGDLDDPTSEVAQIVQREAFMVRKPEKGTGPKIFYLGADESVDSAGNRGAAVHVQGRARCICGRSARRSRIRRPGRSARRLRRAAQEGVGHRPRAVPARQGHLDRRDVPVGALWLLGDRSPLVGLRRTVRRRVVFAAFTAVVLVDRSRAARALLLHPDAAELDVVDGARRVPADGARRARRRCGSLLRILGWDGALTLARAARDDRRVRRRRRTRASCSRRASRAICGRDRTRRSISSRRRRSKAARRCCSSRSSRGARPGDAIARSAGRWRVASLVHLMILVLETSADAERRRCTTSSRCARFATAPTSGCSGSARSACGGVAPLAARRRRVGARLLADRARARGARRARRRPRVGVHLGRGGAVVPIRERATQW